MIATKEIRNKIIGVQHTKRITKTMKMVASSKIRKTQERMRSSRPYAETIRKIISNLLANNMKYKHAYLNKRDVKCVGCLVVATDRGLAGSLNINLFKKLLLAITEWNKKNVEIELMLIGCKAISFFSFLKEKVVFQITGLGDNPTLSRLTEPIKIMLQAYEECRIDKLYIVSNKFVSMMFQIPQILQILPFFPEEKVGFKKKHWDYLYESDPKILLDILLHRYIESRVYESVLENLASEQAARMMAMKIATDNSDNLIKELKVIYNKVRQTSITQELTEIVSGSAAI